MIRGKHASRRPNRRQPLDATFPVGCSYLVDNDVRLLVWSQNRLLWRDDFLWLLEKVRSPAGGELEGAWLSLLTSVFDPQDQTHLEAVFAAAPANHLVAGAFAFVLRPVELHSEEARRQRA